MSDRHPRDMSLAELEALPEVRRVFRVARSFVASDGSVWDVGCVAGAWAKTPNRDNPAAARAPLQRRETSAP